MAILSKIRERSVFLIVVVGLALFAFVLDPSTLQDFFNSSKVNEVGSVNGEAISRQEYAAALENYKTSNQRVTDMQAARNVWDNLLRQKIYTNQLDEAGITIGENDVWQNMIQLPFVQNNPQFQNELGLFNEDLLKNYLLELQSAEDQSTWNAWDTFKNGLALDLQRDTYNNLVSAGLGASLKEGKFQYEEDNTFISADFVYIPFTSVPDSLVKVDKAEIEAYVQAHEKEFQVDAMRDISYVKFDISPTEADKLAIKNAVASTLEDSEDSRGIKSIGFKNATDYQEFFVENESDIPNTQGFRMKDQLPSVITEDVVKGKEGDIFGPYEEGNFFKLTKVTQILKRPDSVKSSHIIIPFIGSSAATAETSITEEEAKKKADSIYSLVRRNKKKFAEIADEINTDGTKGKGGDIGWASHSQAFSRYFDVDYATYIFDNKQGDVGVVKSAYGYHIIRIDEQKNKQNVYKVLTYGKQILPSQETENAIFQQVEKFVLDVANDGTAFFDVASKNNYQTKPAIGLKVMDDRIPGVQGTNREVVRWAFNRETSVGDYKRFDVDKGYIVALLAGKTKEGLKSAAAASGQVRPILVNQKKAALIKEKMSGASLQDIASANSVSVSKMNNVSLKSPVIPGAGTDGKAVGAMFYAKENQLYTQVDGTRGVFAFVVTKRENPTVLTNYEPNRQQVLAEQRGYVGKIFDALKKVSKVEDDRAFYHGVNQ